jgi:hypothetical protein
MKAAILQHACISTVAVLILFSGVSDVRAQSRKSIKLNETAFTFAAQLIKQGHVIGDRKGEWGEHRPSTDQENAFIRAHGFGEYAKWHLGIDDRYPENTKSRYKFPYGDFKNVHRCGVIAAKARARQYGYTEIENAAAELERAISTQSKSNARPRWAIRTLSEAVVKALAVASVCLIRSAFDTNAAATQPFHAVKNASINSGNSSL